MKLLIEGLGKHLRLRLGEFDSPELNGKDPKSIDIIITELEASNLESELEYFLHKRGLGLIEEKRLSK